jgi:HK97 gp10 family phage protein
MPDGVTVKIEGLEELERNMNRLQEDLAKKHAVEAVRAGNQILKQAIMASARAHFQARSGKLFENIRTSVRIKGRGVKGAVVKAFVFLKSDAFYGRFWELGFQHIGHGKGRRSRHRRLRAGGSAGLGEYKRRKWMQPGFEEAAPRALDAVIQKLRSFFGG